MIRGLSKALASFLLVIGLMAPLAASAADPAAEASGFMSEILGMAYDKDELAHLSLTRLYGGFIFEPFGEAPLDQPTALAIVLGYTNIVALILGTVIMAYVILAGAMNTAASGEMLGRSWSSVWLPLRTATAFGLIMPSTQGDTFSVAQSLVVWMIIVGSNSASWVWEKGTEALSTGSPVMATTVHIEADSYVGLAQIMYCSTVRNDMIKKKDKDSKGSKVFLYKKIDPTNSLAEAQEEFYFDEITAKLSADNLANANLITFEGCGTITFPTGQSVVDGLSDKIGLTNRTIHSDTSISKFHSDIQKAFDKAVITNFPALLTHSRIYATNLASLQLNVKAVNAALSTGGEQATGIESKLDESAIRLSQLSAHYSAYIEAIRVASIPPDVSNAWKESMTRGGWMKAGVWFFEASRLQGYVQTMLASLNGIAKPLNDASIVPCSILTSVFTDCDSQNDEFQSEIGAFGEIAERASLLTTSASTLKDASGVSTLTLTVKKKKDAVFFKDNWLDSISVAMSQNVLNGLIYLGESNARGTGSDGGEGGTVKSTSGMVSPFTTVTAMGRGLQQISTLVWATGAVVASGAAWVDAAVANVPDTYCVGCLNAGAGLAKYGLATLVPVLAGIGSLSFMLAFALPFMPVAVWIMLVCGYLLLTIEAIAAAPLAVIMLATPEGEGMAGGNFQKALQMINAIILRPTLSIVGLFAAMTLSYVGFSLLNEMFWSVAHLATKASLFEIMALLFIYTTLAYKVCEYMVSIIHKIPDQIMEWMGGGMSRDFGEGAASQGVTSSLTQNAGAGGLSVGAGLATVGKLNQQRKRQQAREAREAAKGGGTEGGGGGGGGDGGAAKT